MRIPSAVYGFIDGPVRTETDEVTGHEVLTHLQKYSRWGFLITWPFCFNFWYFWKRQDSVIVNGQEEWIPGSEQGIYFRTPGYRYDHTYGMNWTWGYFGLHWD